MRSWILNIHLYGLLLCSAYLIIFGVSSLEYNHPSEFTRGTPSDTVYWKREVRIPDIEDTRALGEALRDSLGLTGWYIPWESYRDSTGMFHFEIGRPGKTYLAEAFPEENRITVEERRKGIWDIIRALHGFSRLPGSSFLGLWEFYTELCTIMVLLGAISGVYLWTARKSERRIGLIILIVSTLFSVLFLVYLILVG